MPNSNIVLQILSLTFLVLNAYTITATNGTRLVLKLMHRDAISHLFHNPSLRIPEPTNHAINSSLSHDIDIRGPLIPSEEGSTLLVNISIGDPPIPQLLAMDTGSSLTWVQPPICSACTPAFTSIYDPKTSSTCTSLSCDSRYQCTNYYDFSNCGQEKQCRYSVHYLDKSSCGGVIVLEKFTFLTSDGGVWEIPDLVFGYGLESSGSIRDLSGILGLQIFRNQYSLVSRVGKKFSYCIGNISDPHYMYNQLVLGEGAVLEGDSTPMRIRHGHYVVSIEGISIGGKQLNVVQKEFDFNVVIDSGSTITLLQRSVFEQLKREIMKLLDGLLRRAIVSNAGERLCYWGNLVRDLKGFPIVTLHLGEGADLYLDVEGTFKRVNDDIFCMAVDVSGSDINIIGVYAQQYYNVGFDLNAMRVSFLSIECELLED
ncbi:hypothetical protein DH2020_018340 [Rehmannia glutinosa]|uniref:Peptidase A1 domain-containing protein n=1 Tax=Rehmannia glutinosa TaxID=99300 RepID=A0ABR0WIN6_REHGL